MIIIQLCIVSNISQEHKDNIYKYNDQNKMIINIDKQTLTSFKFRLESKRLAKKVNKIMKYHVVF